MFRVLADQRPRRPGEIHAPKWTRQRLTRARRKAANQSLAIEGDEFEPVRYRRDADWDWF